MKLVNLEILRAVAAGLVVIYHTLGGLILKGIDIGPMAFFYPLGSAGVDIFFVISGFVIYLGISKQRKSPHLFLKARFRRIIPAYWIATLLTVIFTFAYGAVAGIFGMENSLRPVSALWFIESLFFASNFTGNGMPVVGQGWTLEYEMFFYLLVAAGLLFRMKLAVYLLPLTVLTSLVLFSDLSIMVVEFILGMGLALIFTKFRIKTLLAWVFLALGILLFGLTALLGPEMNPSRITWMLGSLLVVVGAIYLPERNSTIAFKLGAASYAVYLLHALTYPLVNFGFGKLFPVMNLIEVIACVLVSLSIAQVIGLIFESKIDKPLRSWLVTKGL